MEEPFCFVRGFIFQQLEFEEKNAASSANYVTFLCSISKWQLIIDDGCQMIFNTPAVSLSGVAGSFSVETSECTSSDGRIFCLRPLLITIITFVMVRFPLCPKKNKQSSSVAS